MPKPMSLDAAARHTREAVLSRPDELWDQSQGHYPFVWDEDKGAHRPVDKKTCGVCVGVMLADQLCPDADPTDPAYFEAGYIAMCELMDDMAYDTLMLILEECGAGPTPDSIREWPDTRAQVWDRLEIYAYA